METVDVYTERGDLVTCSDCGKVMLLPYGADKCPACKKEGCLVWTDESLREADIDSLLERHCNLHQKSELQPEEYLSLSILVTEYIPYLADKPQTARETLFLLLETGSLSRNTGGIQDASNPKISTRPPSRHCLTNWT